MLFCDSQTAEPYIADRMMCLRSVGLADKEREDQDNYGSPWEKAAAIEKKPNIVLVQRDVYHQKIESIPMI